MRVQHNINAINAHRNLMGNNSKVGKSLEKLSSGYRVNRAGDDAAGLAISEKMRAQISCLTQAENNCNDGISFIQTAEGALTEVHSMLNRMVELAEQSANGIYDTQDRGQIQAEVDQLATEIDRIADSTNFNGTTLLNGKVNNLRLQIGESNKTFDQLKISIASMKTDALKVRGAAEGKGLDVSTTADAAGNALDVIKAAINTVSTERGKLGAWQNRLEHTINNLSVTNENMTAAEARIRDTDMAKEMMNYTKNNILSQAAQSMLAQANTQPQQVLSLLQ